MSNRHLGRGGIWLVVCLLLAQTGWTTGETETSPVLASPDSMPAVNSPLSIRLSLPDAVMQGQILTVRISSPYPLRLQAAWFPDLHSPAILPGVLDLGLFGESWTYSLVLGIGVDAIPGQARLILSAWTAGLTGDLAAPVIFPAWQSAPGSFMQFDRVIQIRKAAFRSETLPLTQDMANIKTLADPKKDQQIRRYATILAKVDPQAIWLRSNLAGSFIRPVASDRHTSWFGDNRLYQYPDGSRERSWHFGVDYGVPTGTPVLAPARGRVVMAENRITTGWTVILEHLPGLYTIYMHMSQLQVIEGQLVEQADRLGESGATGFATGPHLHWELRVAGVACDPESLIAPISPNLTEP